jgi:hypothetical protein
MSFTACPNCGAHIDPSAFPRGTRLTCFECGKSFAVGDPPRAPEAPPNRADPEKVYELPSSPPAAAPAPRLRRERSASSERDAPGTERWIAFGVCLFLLVVVLGGIGYLVWQAHSEGSRGSTTAPPPQPNFRKLDRKGDFDNRDFKKE